MPAASSFRGALLLLTAFLYARIHTNRSIAGNGQNIPPGRSLNDFDFHPGEVLPFFPGSPDSLFFQSSPIGCVPAAGLLDSIYLYQSISVGNFYASRFLTDSFRFMEAKYESICIHSCSSVVKTTIRGSFFLCTAQSADRPEI